MSSPRGAAHVDAPAESVPAPYRMLSVVVGGIDGASTKAAVGFNAQVCDTVVQVEGTREAEMAKLLENTFRHVNIALVNEMAVFCHELDIDLWQVIEAAKTKPFGFMAFYPGPGVGGHCIPSTRPTCRGGYARWASPSASSSSPRRSTPRCRATS